MAQKNDERIMQLKKTIEEKDKSLYQNQQDSIQLLIVY